MSAPPSSWGWKARAGAGCATLLLLVAALVGYRVHRRHQVVVRTEPASRVARLEAKVTASGEVKAKEFIDIQSDVPGVVTELLVREGDHVKRGDVLLKIDPAQSKADADATVALSHASEAEAKGQQAAIRAAEASLARERAALETARGDKDVADRALEIARASHERQRKLAEGGLLSRELLDASESQLLQARTQADGAGTRLRQAQAQLAVTQVALEQARAGYQAALMRVDSARANAARAADVLGKTVLTSPLDGVVTYLGVEAGERAVPGIMSNPQATLLTIADLSHIEVELKVDETDVIAIERGAAAKVTVDALPDAAIAGTVSEIGASPLPRAIGSSDDAAKDFKVVVTLKDPPPQLRPGLSATAEITTRVKEGVLTVPFQALVVREAEVDKDGRFVKAVVRRGAEGRVASAAERQARKEMKGVFVVAGGRVAFRPVETGIAGDMEVEVASGVREGDEVVTGSFKTLRQIEDGDRVRVDNSLVIEKADLPAAKR